MDQQSAAQRSRGGAAGLRKRGHHRTQNRSRISGFCRICWRFPPTDSRKVTPGDDIQLDIQLIERVRQKSSHPECFRSAAIASADTGILKLYLFSTAGWIIGPPRQAGRPFRIALFNQIQTEQEDDHVEATVHCIRCRAHRGCIGHAIGCGARVGFCGQGGTRSDGCRSALLSDRPGRRRLRSQCLARAVGPLPQHAVLRAAAEWRLQERFKWLPFRLLARPVGPLPQHAVSRPASQRTMGLTEANSPAMREGKTRRGSETSEH
jgi:hypothetical protein